MDTKQFQESWINPSYRIGTITLAAACIFSFSPVVYLIWNFKLDLAWSDVFFTWMKLCAAFGALYVVEPIAYYSSLGFAGTYLSFLSGNIGNLRVPCAYMALKVTDTKPGTKEAEIISTLGISGSIIVNLVIVAIGAFLSGVILLHTPDFLKDAFRRFITPAVYGAMIGQLGLSMPKLVPFAVFFPLLMRIYVPSLPGWIVNILSIVIIVFLARKFYYKKEA